MEQSGQAWLLLKVDAVGVDAEPVQDFPQGADEFGAPVSSEQM